MAHGPADRWPRTVHLFAPSAPPRRRSAQAAHQVVDKRGGELLGEWLVRIAAEPPLERIGTPDDIAELVVFLAGPGRWVNGQVLYANGGAV